MTEYFLNKRQANKRSPSKDELFSGISVKRNEAKSEWKKKYEKMFVFSYFLDFKLDFIHIIFYSI